MRVELQFWLLKIGNKVGLNYNNVYKQKDSKLIMEKDIGKINKGEYEGTITDIVIGIREYNGKVGVDIREFVAGEKYTGPTKKGLRIPADKFEEFKTLINSINTSDLAEASGESAEQTALPSEEPKEDSEESSDESSTEDASGDY